LEEVKGSQKLHIIFNKKEQLYRNDDEKGKGSITRCYFWYPGV